MELLKLQTILEHILLKIIINKHTKEYQPQNLYIRKFQKGKVGVYVSINTIQET